MRKFFVLLMIIIVSTAGIACKEKKKDTAIFLTFTIGSVFVNNLPVTAGKHLNESDILRTGHNSFATMQLGETILVSINSATEIMIHKIMSDTAKDETIIDLHIGYIFSKLLRGKHRYSIKTPTVVAAVRATSFAVIYDNKTGRNSILSLEGRVAVIPVKESDARFIGVKDKSEYLDPGNKIEFKSGTAAKKSDLKAGELDELKKFNKIQPIPEAREAIVRNDKFQTEDRATSVDNVSKSITALSESQKKQIMEAITPGTSAIMQGTKELSYEEKLNKIKIQNRGQLDVITLKNGRVIKGMLLERGLIYRIKTPTGVVEITRDDVVSQTIIK